MRLIRPPAAPILVRVISWIVALIVGGTIVYLVFTFGYVASGLASYNEEQRRREAAPIPVNFADPNS